MLPEYYRMLFRTAMFAIATCMGCLPGAAQSSLAESILKTADIPGKCDPQALNGQGCCGAPGRRICAGLTCNQYLDGWAERTIHGCEPTKKRSLQRWLHHPVR
jgi:hypothetical protein